MRVALRVFILIPLTAGVAKSAPAQSTPDTSHGRQWRAVSVVSSRLSNGMDNQDTLVLANGTRFATGLYRVHVLDVLPRSTKPPFLVLWGTMCTECDGVPLIYIQSPADGPVHYRTQVAYSGPGIGYSSDIEDTVPLIRARMFIGTCLSSMTVGVVWFAEQRERTSWHSVVHVIDVMGDSLRIRDLEKPLPGPRDAQPFVGNGSCHEVRPGQ